MIDLKSSNFQLLGKPRIIKHIFQINKEYNFIEEISLEIDSEIKIGKRNEKEMTVEVLLALEFFKHQIFDTVPFKLEMEIDGVFGWNDEQDKDQERLDILLKENAPAILYSYLRPVITGTSIDANLPPLVIPLMNFRKES